MTKVEAIKLVAIAVAAFPAQQERNVEPTTDVWFRVLGDLDFNLAQAALTKVLATSKYFPTVAEVREAASSLMQSDLPQAELAWAEFLREKRNHGYMDAPQSLRAADDTSKAMTFREPWDFSHPAIGATVKAMYGSWQGAYDVMMDETIGVDRKHFTDMYVTVSKRQHEFESLPPAVRDFAAMAAAKLKALPDTGGKRGPES